VESTLKLFLNNLNADVVNHIRISNTDSNW
jgi:hypothetical protein